MTLDVESAGRSGRPPTDELKRVGASVQASPADLFFGREATETRVKQSALDQYRTVYFATHGLLAGDVQNFAKLNAEPALVLSLPPQPTTLDDGLLTASEVAQLKLNAEWVVRALGLQHCVRRQARSGSAVGPGARVFLCRRTFTLGVELGGGDRKHSCADDRHICRRQ